MKKTKIFLFGQCTLHWGRMEFGNIGNYYIIEPFIRQLHETFGNAEINTTLQMSNLFCEREKVNVLPMDYYYAWSDNDLNNALVEMASAELYSKTGLLPEHTQFIDTVLNSDIVIDFSGDIWGDNADFLGKDRFLVGLIKDRVAQLLGKPTFMLAGSPGPFKNQNTKEFAKEVLRNFDLVTNRETISAEILKREGFDTSNVKSLACPSFLFEPTPNGKILDLLKEEGLIEKSKPIVGFIICGWNFTKGPFDKESRDDSEFAQFVEAIEFISEKIGAKICLMSHNNGFKIPPNIFELLHGRDYSLAKQLQRIVKQRGVAQNLICLDGVYDAWTTKAIIGNFNMLISGRIHGSVAGISQNVPTVMIDYGHEPKAHKIRGFAEVVGISDYVADPAIADDLKDKIKICWKNRASYVKCLKKRNPEVREMAKQNFELIKDSI